MCFVVDEDPPDWSVSLTQSQDGRRTDRRETGDRQERTRQNITGGKTREDTDHDRGHERDEMIEETWWDNDGGDGTTGGQQRTTENGDKTERWNERTETETWRGRNKKINSTWWGQQQTGDTKQEMTQWKTQDSSGTTWRQTRNKWTTWDKSTRRLWGRDDEDDNTRWTRTF